MNHSPSERAAVDAAAHQHQYVTFSMAGEMFAVPMAPVQEIIRVPEVARLPLAPPALDGLANLRGRVLPIVNLRRIFGVGPREADDATRALVIHIGQPLGFVVDRVASVVSVEPEQVEPASAIQSVVAAEYLTGVIKRPGSDGRTQLLLTLDFERLVQREFARGAAAAGGLRSLGTAAAAPAPVAAVASDDWRLVSFTVAAQEYAVDIAAVQEIVQVPEAISALPNAPAHVLGLISLRSRLLPLVSLRALFGLAPVAPDEHHRIVVLALPGGAQVGLVTDAVKEVLSVPRAQADAMPAVLADGGQLHEFSAICRLDGGKRLVSIVDSQRLLGLPALQAAAALGGPDPTASAAASACGAESTDLPTPPEKPMPQASHDGAAATDDDDMQVVIFRLGAEEFGVPIMSVQEIVRVPEVLTRVPKTPHFVEGVINLRGTVLPVIDQRSRLGMDSIARNDRQRIMVYTLGGRRTGFIVDSVAEVLRIPRAQIEPAPELSEEQGRLISRVAKLERDRRLVMLIDPAQLLGSAELRAVARLGDEPAALPRAA